MTFPYNPYDKIMKLNAEIVALKSVIELLLLILQSQENEGEE